ncbi:unnamed protein product [Urochloa humidicola]
MGGGLEFDLSRGAVPALWSCSLGSRWRPVLQVADARHVPDGSGLRPAPEQRYRIDLSDGVHSQPGTLAASLNHLVRDGSLRRGTVVRLLNFVCDYNRRTITVIQLQILQTECTLIGSLKLYEPTRKSGGFTTSMRYSLRPDEPYFRGQHIHQSCIPFKAEETANGLSYHGPCGGSSPTGGDKSRSVALLAESAVWKTIQEIKDENLGYSDEPDFIKVKAFISFMKSKRFCSAACPLVVNGRRCNVKATGNGDGTWHCKSREQSRESRDGACHYKRCVHGFDSCDYGYLVRIQIQDHTGMTYATVYEEAAKEIFGCTAKDLFLMEHEEQDYQQLGDIKRVVACKQYVLQLKVEAKPFSDPHGVECVVLKAENVKPSAESHRLLGAINTHLREGLDSCRELGGSIPSYTGLSDFKGHSTARSSNSSHSISPGRARLLCSPDRYSQQANEYDVKPSVHSGFGAYGCGDHGSGIDGQRSRSPDFFVDRFHGASGIDGQRSWSPDFFVDRFHGSSGTDGQRAWSPDFFVDRVHGASGTDGQRAWSPDFFVDRVHGASGTDGQRSWSPDFFVDRVHGASGTDGQRSWSPDLFVYRVHGASPAVNLAPDVRCTHSKRTTAHGAGRSARKL